MSSAIYWFCLWGLLVRSSKLKRDVLGTFRNTRVNMDKGNLGPQQILKTFIIKYLFSLYVLCLKPVLPSYTVYSPIPSPPPSLTFYGPLH